MLLVGNNSDGAKPDELVDRSWSGTALARPFGIRRCLFLVVGLSLVALLRWNVPETNNDVPFQVNRCVGVHTDRPHRLGAHYILAVDQERLSILPQLDVTVEKRPWRAESLLG